ncbi:type VII secretion integral membrane protein EccD [Hamadaea flava]|uniref:Type VII secretion integral membrane protein EccD n=1 Tax=Hamadaea flava TaxID=1742688 RepID=A0ABV8LZ68_9ACTN|nr:type VII secretion integral membrane protein EccD [Hamadaea flava]MCP2321604.1 type VII secretion integral membrane protein EccD [Hamadaea flava]
MTVDIAPAVLAAPRRVTIAAPATRVDVSLPPQATVAELVPQLVRMAGAVGGGWTLGRLGDEPFDPGSTVASAGIRDGEVLHLYAQGGGPLPVLFDDVADAVVAAHAASRWRPEHARRAGLAVATLAVAGSAAALPLVGRAAVAVGCLLAATALARSSRGSAAGTVIAATGIPAVAAAAPLAGVNWAVAGAAAITGYALCALVLVPAARVWFAGLVVAGVLGLGTALLTTVAGPIAVAPIIAVLPVLTLLMPGIAVRLGRLPLPRLPADQSALATDIRPAAGADVVAAAKVSARMLTSLLAGAVAVEVGAVGVLLRLGRPWSLALAVLAGIALTLRVRAYVQVGQRVVLLSGGLAVLAEAGATLANSGDPARLVLITVLAAGALAGLVTAVRPDQPPSPYLLRLLDILEFAALIGLLPTALAVLDAYARIRGLTR